MNVSTTTQETAGQQVWKAVVLYNELECGKQAARLLDRVAERAGAPESCDRSMWRFDVMEHPDIAREALYEARDADLVLLSARGVDRPPSWLMEWLEMWAMTRHVKEAVLAAWCKAAHTGRLRHAMGGLRHLADRHELDFICADDVARGH